MIWLPWRKEIREADERVKEAERLRDEAWEQRCQVDSLYGRVDRVASSLERLWAENHIGPLIDTVLRGHE